MIVYTSRKQIGGEKVCQRQLFVRMKLLMMHFADLSVKSIRLEPSKNAAREKLS